MTHQLPAQISGVVPSLCLKAEIGPPRSECGIGGLVPWIGKLWAITYLSHRKATGSGTGLYEIDENLKLTKRPESYPGTYANRYIHHPSNQLFIGPWVIDIHGNVRTITKLLDVRLAGTASHLTDPENKVLFLGMEGEFLEVDVHTLEVTQLFDLCQVLETPGEGRVHWKDIYTAFGRVVVADNTYDEKDYRGETSDGRLAEWDGTTWRIIDRNPYVCVHGLGDFAHTMFALGWDRSSVILKAFTHADNTWRTYRLPKASHTFEHMWQTEWPRIRSTEHERLLMDAHGMFYELSPWAYGNRIWGIRPISTHLWVIPDFCTYRGLLVLGSDNTSADGNQNVLCAEPQSGLWFGKTDDLWKFGKPKGWGGVWWNNAVQAGTPSDPYLMTGFDHKCLHLSHQSDQAITFTVEVDFQGDGQWHTYSQFTVAPHGYLHHEFPAGFSAHWVRVIANHHCTATAQFHYT